MANSRAVGVLYLLEPAGWLILELLVPLSAGASRMAHSRAVSVPIHAGASRMAHSSS